MNKLSETENKVVELERRLDNELEVSGLGVQEFKREDIFDTVAGQLTYKIARLSKTISGGAVLQGQFDFSVTVGGTIRIELVVDGYTTKTISKVLQVGEQSVSILNAINTESASFQEIEIIISLQGGGEVVVQGYDFFIFGFGLEFSETPSENTRIRAVETDIEASVFLVASGNGYIFRMPYFMENLSFSSFSKISESILLSGGYLTDESGAPKLYILNLTPSKELKLGVYGEEGIVIDSGVSSFSIVGGRKGSILDKKSYEEARETVEEESENGATNLLEESSSGSEKVGSQSSNSTEIEEFTVAYAKGNELYYFTYDGVNKSANVFLKAFEENILDITIVDSNGLTDFLVVSLDSGKNYLFSSVTKILSPANYSSLMIKASISFNG